jgi:hypothetical protein
MAGIVVNSSLVKAASFANPNSGKVAEHVAYFFRVA